MPDPEDRVDDSGQDDEDSSEAEDDDRPVLYELHIRPPKGKGRGKSRLVPWWNRASQYKMRRLGKLRRHKKKEEARLDV